MVLLSYSNQEIFSNLNNTESGRDAFYISKSKVLGTVEALKEVFDRSDPADLVEAPVSNCLSYFLQKIVPNKFDNNIKRRIEKKYQALERNSAELLEETMVFNNE